MITNTGYATHISSGTASNALSAELQHLSPPGHASAKKIKELNLSNVDAAQDKPSLLYQDIRTQ